MQRSRRSEREVEDDESELDNEFKVEDLQDTYSTKSSSWRNMYPFNLFRNYYSRQHSIVEVVEISPLTETISVNTLFTLKTEWPRQHSFFTSKSRGFFVD
ncbi:hypothetical protein ACJIZ3_010114 [Penstemon smallii]|uniref:Uncharacterized protein n=1 Tax=Penstemon smallii TaxID=265156 RepID=A0ABD3TG94_9LAMI